MEMKVIFLAALRDGSGVGEIRLPWKQGITCRQILEELKERFESVSSLLERSLVAVNGNYAGPDWDLMPEDEIAILPPVSGG